MASTKRKSSSEPIERQFREDVKVMVYNRTVPENIDRHIAEFASIDNPENNGYDRNRLADVATRYANFYKGSGNVPRILELELELRAYLGDTLK